MDTAGNKAARTEIAMIKVAAPNMLCTVLDWAIQGHGRAAAPSTVRPAQQPAAPPTAQVTAQPRLTEARAAYTGGKDELQESHDAVIGRMQAPVSAAVAAHPGGRIVMVSHGIAILTYL